MLTSHTSRMAQTLGLHRQSAFYFERGLSNAEVTERQSIYWMIYVLEKILSITFGRTSSLPRYDCDVDKCMFPLELDFVPTAMTPDGLETVAQRRRWFGLWKTRVVLSIAEVFDLIYVRLYSAQALKQSSKEKRQAVRELDVMLRRTWVDVQQWIAESRYTADSAMKTMIREAKFMFHVCMTMIHRVSKAIPDDEDDLEADKIITPSGPRRSQDVGLEAARRALQLVHELTRPTENAAVDMTACWCLIFQPFAPFFEVFLSVVRTRSRDDLKLLRQTTAIFKGLNYNSDSVIKLHRVAELFTRTATLIVLKDMTTREQFLDTLERKVDKIDKLQNKTSSNEQRNFNEETISEQQNPTPTASETSCLPTPFTDQVAFDGASNAGNAAALTDAGPDRLANQELEALFLGGNLPDSAFNLDWSTFDWSTDPATELQLSNSGQNVCSTYIGGNISGFP